LGRGSNEAVADVEAARTAKASARGCDKFAGEAVRAGRTADDRRANWTAIDWTDFSGRTNAKQAEITCSCRRLWRQICR
jgi:hypothetical protein